MSCVAIIAVKAPAAGKSRLAAVLSSADRRRLASRLLAAVGDALRRTPGIDRIAVVSPEPHELGADVHWLADAGSGLNEAAMLGANWARAQGFDEMLFLHADLPHATASGLVRVLDHGREHGTALVPDRAGQGTNVVFLRLEKRFEFAFGPGSLARHRAQAGGEAVVAVPELAFDIDTPSDLAHLATEAGYRDFAPTTPEDAAMLDLIAAAQSGERLGRDALMRLTACTRLEPLLEAAEALTLAGHGRNVTYSRKVFIPLTRLCRNRCAYCTFAEAPGTRASEYLSPDEVLAIARQGAALGCKEALFTLGDRPEDRYPEARAALQALGFSSTLDYVADMARRVQRETGLLPHLNPGVMSHEEMQRLRPAAVSMGLMLESSAKRLCRPGGPHHRSPDKVPAVRLATLKAAGELAIPFTSGLLIGIGETRAERIDALLALRELQDKYGHLQEIILQNFRAKDDTGMAGAPEPDLQEHLWTIAMARLVFGPHMSLQAPPNLRAGELAPLLRAGINDWGGVSPLTPDHVNPEKPWPHIAALAAETAACGRHLVERLAVGPAYVRHIRRWADESQLTPVLRAADAFGYARTPDWHPGTGVAPPANASTWLQAPQVNMHAEMHRLIGRAVRGERLAEADVVRLFAAEGDDLNALLTAADRLRADSAGNDITYVVNCNINYTNICQHRCGFCAFAKGRTTEALRGPAYLMSPDDVAAKALDAWQRGAREVCLQGGIHPQYTGQSYLDILTAVKTAVPDMHVHAFSPLEVWTGAQTLGVPLRDFLAELREAGLGSLPGTAAEVLDDEVRAQICTDKLTTREWLEVMATAHRVGLKSTATIMFGHVDHPVHWARHLLRLRDLQEETGGFTEFVPLPFVHMESPLWRRGQARSGPTLREVLAMHAVARLVLHPLIRNIQTSWPKLGPEGALLCLQAGANDIGGTLMYESITRAAGGVNGQAMTAEAFSVLAERIGRPLRQRTTLYQNPTSARRGDGTVTRIPIQIFAAD